MAANINIGKWSPSDDIYGDVDGGFPLVVFDSKLENTVVLSPWNAFMAANQISFTDSTTGGKVLSFGPLGSITEVSESSLVDPLALSAGLIPNCKRRKAGGSLGTRLTWYYMLDLP